MSNPPLSVHQLHALLHPYTAKLQLEAREWEKLCLQLQRYLDLLLRWNARTNLTAVRDAEHIVHRHFGESLFAAGCLQEVECVQGQVCDVGSGAGFPGVPIKLALPSLELTLVESQGKKAAFLREVARTLSLEAEVWSGRLDAMPAERKFEVVTIRAVDRMELVLEEAGARVRAGGVLLVLSSTPFPGARVWTMPEAEKSFVSLLRT